MPAVSVGPDPDALVKVLWDVFAERRSAWADALRDRLAGPAFVGTDPEDVLQSVWARAQARLGRFVEWVTKEAAGRPAEWDRMARFWLARLVRQARIDLLRRRAAFGGARKTVAFPERSGEQYEQGLVAGGPTPSAEAAGKEEGEAMRLLHHLNPVDARIVRLRVTEGLDFPAIAKALGGKRTADAVNRRCLRALRKLKELTGRGGPPSEDRP